VELDRVARIAGARGHLVATDRAGLLDHVQVEIAPGRFGQCADAAEPLGQITDHANHLLWDTTLDERSGSF
jgi:hypothetical protein